MKKVKKVKGFVMNKITGHASYAFKQDKTIVNSIGFTHNQNDCAEKKQLKYNINPKDTRDCYAKTKVEKQKYNTYREKESYKNYRIHKVDKPIINSIIGKPELKLKKNKKRR